MRNLQTKQCLGCNTMCQQRYNESKSMFRDRQYCSHRCSATGRTGTEKQKQAARDYWRKNRNPLKLSEVIRQQALKRDDYGCQKCGEKNNLEVDHIIPRIKAPELINDLNNLMTLCRECHLHKTLKERVRKYNPEKRLKKIKKQALELGYKLVQIGT